MNNEAKNELDEEYHDEFEGVKHYFFAPSITKRRTVNGKSYIVRSYFMGGKDFAKAMESLAVKQAYKNQR